MRLYSASPNASISMQPDSKLDAWLDQLIIQHGVHHAIETGTYLGTGSTATVAKAFVRNRASSARFDTIEVSWKHYCLAKNNLYAYPFVKCHWGLSVGFQEAVDFIENDPLLSAHEDEPHIYIDETTNPREFYLAEIRGHLTTPETGTIPPPASQPPDRLLEPLLAATPASNSLILLDSAGAIGLLEFQMTLTAMRTKSYFILLDDTEHIKHYRSKHIIAQSSNFEILAAGEQRDWLLAVHRPSR